MKKKYYIVFLFSFLFTQHFGYLRQVDASFCMDDCSQYMLEEENGSFAMYLANTNDIDLSYYINRYVEIVSGGEYECIECSAMIIESIQIYRVDIYLASNTCCFCKFFHVFFCVGYKAS